MARPQIPVDNPFTQQRDARSVVFRFRMTPAEHAAVKAIADREKTDIVGLIREGLALVIEARQKTRTR